MKEQFMFESRRNRPPKQKVKRRDDDTRAVRAQRHQRKARVQQVRERELEDLYAL